MIVTTKIVWDAEGKVIEHQYYDYAGPVALCGGPSGGEKAVAGQEESLFTTMSNNYAQVFGDSSQVFGDLMQTFSPIVAAGPSQEGFSETEWNARSAEIKQQTGLAATHVEQAAQDRWSAMGGAIPSGAREAMLSKIGTQAAIGGSEQMGALRAEDYAVGHQNWLDATRGLMGAPAAFAPATQAGEAAGKAGAESFQAQQEMAQQSSSWMGVVGGILGQAAKGATMAAMR